MMNLLPFLSSNYLVKLFGRGGYVYRRFLSKNGVEPTQTNTKNWNINESVFTIKPNLEKVTSEFLYMFLSSDYIKSYTKNVSAGSIHKGIRHSLLKDCKYILPERNTIDAFTIKIQPILKKLELIQKENQKLTELRDWLLPMLMNGQVKVN